MYQRYITFAALSLTLVAAIPAMVSANINNVERQQILSQDKDSQFKTHKLHRNTDNSASHSQSQRVKPLTPSTAQALLEKVRIKSRMQAAKASYNLSIIAAKRKNYTQAHTFIEEAVQLNYSNPKFLTLAADISFITQKYDKAEEYQLELLKIVLSTQDPDDLRVALAQDQLGAIYFAQERYEETKFTLQTSLQLREKVLGNSHLLIVTSLNKLATLAIRQQQASAAELLLKRALKIAREVSGKRHANSAAMLANLADLYQSEKRLQEAELLYKEAISIWVDSPGDPLRQATGQNSLGRLLLDQRRFDDARFQFKQALLLLNGSR